MIHFTAKNGTKKYIKYHTLFNKLSLSLKNHLIVKNNSLLKHKIINKAINNHGKKTTNPSFFIFETINQNSNHNDK